MHMHIYTYIHMHTHAYAYTRSTCNGILFSHKKEEMLPLWTTGMAPENLMLSEISQRKGKYYMISLTCEI